MNIVRRIETAERDQGRRRFLQAGVAGAAGLMLSGVAGAQSSGLDRSPKNLAAILYPGAVEDGRYVLPRLPYAYDALEPHIDAETMQLHHARHHQGYVNGLIQAEEQLAAARLSGEWQNVEQLHLKAAFHGAGHFLHCIFWASMAPEGSRGEPSSALASQIQQDFGSHDAMIDQFSRASLAVEGNGWGVLSWSIPASKLVILQARNHQDASQWGNIPLLAIDVWEHAYYKRYSNQRGEYIKHFLEVVNWGNVSERFEATRAALG